MSNMPAPLRRAYVSRCLQAVKRGYKIILILIFSTIPKLMQTVPNLQSMIFVLVLRIHPKVISKLLTTTSGAFLNILMTLFV